MLFTLLLAGSTTLLQAHPGHALHDSSAVHVLSSPYHLLCLGLAGIICFVAAWFTAHRPWRRALITTGSCLFAAGIAVQLF